MTTWGNWLRWAILAFILIMQFRTWRSMRRTNRLTDSTIELLGNVIKIQRQVFVELAMHSEVTTHPADPDRVLVNVRRDAWEQVDLFAVMPDPIKPSQ